MRLPDCEGVTSQWNRNVVAGMGEVTSSKERPATTCSSRIRWVRAPVVIVPVVPLSKGPSRLIVRTSGFHSGQVLVSDQIFQMRSDRILTLWPNAGHVFAIAIAASG